MSGINLNQLDDASAITREEYRRTNNNDTGATPKPVDLCEECGKPYEKRRHDQRFCTPDCRKKQPRAPLQPRPRKKTSTAAVTAGRHDEASIRRDERRRLADLLEEHRDTLVDFVPSADKMLDLVIVLLHLQGDR